MKNANRLLYLLALVKFILPFFLQNGVFEPHRDELLYLAEGRHMAWGFMEVPPLLSVFAWLTNLFGDSIFAIKVWPSLIGALTYILTGKIILSIGGRSYALLLGFLPFILGGYLRVHFLFQPNCLEIFFWTAMTWSIIRHIQTGQNKWLYILGVSTGLAFLSKYSVAFYIAGLIVGLLATSQRKIFTNKHLYFAAAIAFLIFLPNLLWQFHRGFPVVYHMKELQDTQLQYLSPAAFLTGQLIMHLPVFFIWIAGLGCLLFSRAVKEYRFIGLAYLTVLVLLLLGHGKDYYALGTYPPLFAFGAWWLSSITVAKYKWLRYVFALLPFLVVRQFLPVALPIFTPAKLDAFYQNNKTAKLGVLKWEDGKSHPLPQDFADMLGWDEMAHKASIAYHLLSIEEQKRTLLFCDNYGQAGALNFYRDRYDLPPAYSDNASFLYWMPEHFDFDHVVLVTDDEHEMEHPFIKDFRSATVADSVINTYARERGDLIIVLKGANSAFHDLFTHKLEKKRSKVTYK